MKSSVFLKKDNKERVRKHRRTRRDAGLKEIKIWICESDIKKIHKVLYPFLQKADKLLLKFRKDS